MSNITYNNTTRALSYYPDGIHPKTVDLSREAAERYQKFFTSVHNPAVLEYLIDHDFELNESNYSVLTLTSCINSINKNEIDRIRNSINKQVNLLLSSPDLNKKDRNNLERVYNYLLSMLSNTLTRKLNTLYNFLASPIDVNNLNSISIDGKEAYAVKLSNCTINREGVQFYVLKNDESKLLRYKTKSSKSNFLINELILSDLFDPAQYNIKDIDSREKCAAMYFLTWAIYSDGKIDLPCIAPGFNFRCLTKSNLSSDLIQFEGSMSCFKDNDELSKFLDVNRDTPYDLDYNIIKLDNINQISGLETSEQFNKFISTIRVVGSSRGTNKSGIIYNTDSAKHSANDIIEADLIVCTKNQYDQTLNKVLTDLTYLERGNNTGIIRSITNTYSNLLSSNTISIDPDSIDKETEYQIITNSFVRCRHNECSFKDAFKYSEAILLRLKDRVGDSFPVLNLNLINSDLHSYVKNHNIDDRSLQFLKILLSMCFMYNISYPKIFNKYRVSGSLRDFKSLYKLSKDIPNFSNAMLIACLYYGCYDPLCLEYLSDETNPMIKATIESINMFNITSTKPRTGVAEFDSFDIDQLFEKTDELIKKEKTLKQQQIIQQKTIDLGDKYDATYESNDDSEVNDISESNEKSGLSNFSTLLEISSKLDQIINIISNKVQPQPQPQEIQPKNKLTEIQSNPKFKELLPKLEKLYSDKQGEKAGLFINKVKGSLFDIIIDNRLPEEVLNEFNEFDLQNIYLIGEYIDVLKETGVENEDEKAGLFTKLFSFIPHGRTVYTIGKTIYNMAKPLINKMVNKYNEAYQKSQEKGLLNLSEVVKYMKKNANISVGEFVDLLNSK